MRQIFKIFFSAEDTKPWLVLLCLLLGGIAEAVGIGSLLPVASTLLGSENPDPSAFEKLVRGTIESLGISLTFANLLMLLVCIMVLRSILLFVAMTYAGISGARVTINLRRKLIKSLFDAKWSFYAGQSGGRVANAISNDATRAGDAYNLSATAAAMSLQIIAYAVVAFLINWRVALAGIAGGLLIATLSSGLVRVSKKSGYKQADRVATLTSDMVDMLQNIKALKSMNRYDSLINNLSVLLKKLKRTLFTQYFARYGLTYGNDILVSLLIGLGAYLAHTYAKVSLPELMVFGILFFQVIAYVAKLLKQIQLAAQVEGAHTRISELIASAASHKEAVTGGKTPDLGKGCHFQAVSFSHADKPTLVDVSLDIPANRITVLQGPSGAGKTTIIDLLVGFHLPKSGKIFVGKDLLSTVSLADWRSMIGYVPQELALFHDTVKANITLYDETISDSDVETAVTLSGVAAFLDILPQGINTDVGEYGSKLSGGQRQRISLARALVRNPKILILDEVTSALDPDTEASIVANIAALRGRFTIIAITHRPAWTKIADRLYHLDRGRIKSLTTTKMRKSSK